MRWDSGCDRVRNGERERERKCQIDTQTCIYIKGRGADSAIRSAKKRKHMKVSLLSSFGESAAHCSIVVLTLVIAPLILGTIFSAERCDLMTGELKALLGVCVVSF